MPRSLLLCVLVVVCCQLVVAQQPFGCTGQPNTLPVWSGPSVLMNQTANGLRFQAGFYNDSTPVTVLHLYGTPYEMGLAQGTLMKQEIASMMEITLPWVCIVQCVSSRRRRGSCE